MHTTDNDTPPRWGDLKALQARFPGAFGRTRAYEMLNSGQLRAKKLGRRTLWDFAAAEALIEGSPDLGKVA